MRVLSLGWGVQSFTLAAMSALGAIPRFDLIVHSDTRHERTETYQFAQTWLPWLREHGQEVVTTRPTPTESLPFYQQGDGKNVVMIPAFSAGGPIQRQCTKHWKVRPTRRVLQQRRGQESVELAIGISTDEHLRAKDSDVAYIENRFPLLDLSMKRSDCTAWLQDERLAVPGKSACVFCPFHSKREWQELKRAGASDWDKALSVDEQVRDKRPPDPLFVHSSRLPLAQAVDIPEDHGYVQTGFDPEGKCDEGMCWV